MPGVGGWVPELGKLGKLIKGYHLLAATIDGERALVGQVSNRWLDSEIECTIRVGDIPMPTLNTYRGSEILASTFYPDQDLDPASIRLDLIDQQDPRWDTVINTNRLPKLEPRINGLVLSATMLQGVRRYGDNGSGHRDITSNLVVATLIHDCFGKVDTLASLKPSEYPTVDFAYVEAEFGKQVALHARNIAQHMAEFKQAFAVGKVDQLNISSRYANAIACLAAGELRLSARAAGEHITQTLSPFKKRELVEAGVDIRGAFPEREILERDYHMLRAAFSLPGVDYSALREPVENSLLQGVEDVLNDSRKRNRLIGRRGRAVHEVHINLPIMEYYDAAATPDNIATIHLAALEMTRHLDRCRRKSRSTMAAHAFNLAHAAWEAFGENLDISIACATILHDVVEDGSAEVAGYNHSLRLLRKRFGGPIAAMVGEVTDASDAEHGQRKAAYTADLPGLRTAQKAYNVGRYTSMRIRATDVQTPYTVAGIITKLVDTAMTFDESVRDPESLGGWWRDSGIRIYWAERVRGPIVRPLINKLVKEIERSRTDAQYHATLGLSQEMLEGMVRLIEDAVEAADRYMTQNLVILAGEYGLNAEEEQRLLTAFCDPGVDEASFADEILHKLLDDNRLREQVAKGKVPSFSHVVLFPKSDSAEPPRNEITLLRYRETYMQRREYMARLKLDDDQHDAFRAADSKAVANLYHTRCDLLPIQYNPDSTPAANVADSSSTLSANRGS